MFPVRWPRWILIQHKWSEGFYNLGGIVASVVMVRNPSRLDWTGAETTSGCKQIKHFVLWHHLTPRDIKKVPIWPYDTWVGGLQTVCVCLRFCYVWTHTHTHTLRQHAHTRMHTNKHRKEKNRTQWMSRSKCGKQQKQHALYRHTRGKYVSWNTRSNKHAAHFKLLRSVDRTCGLLVLRTETEQQAVHKHVRTAEWQPLTCPRGEGGIKFW